MNVLDAFRSDIRYAWRSLSRNKAFTAACVGIVALGVAFSAILFAVLNGALMQPWPYNGYGRLVTIRGNYPSLARADYSLWSAAEIEDLRSATDIFDHVIAGDARNVNLIYNGHPQRVRAAVITPDAFEMLGVPAQLGRALREADAAAGAAPSVVLSYRFWQTRLGSDPEIVGRTLRIADTEYDIVGVMPEGFVFWDRDLWMPLRLNATDVRGDRRFYAQGRLREGLSVDAASHRLALVAGRFARDHPEQRDYNGMTIAIGRLVDDVLRDLRPMLYLLLGAVVLLLLVASANLGNAMLARAIAREGELAVRRALGASRGQIARQLVVESGAIGVVGGLTGATAAAFLLPYVVGLVPYGYIPAEARITLDWRVVSAACAAAVLSAIAFTIAPANRAALIDPVAALKSGDTRTGSRRSHRVQRLFVVAQLTLAVVVLGVAASAYLSVGTTVQRSPGFDTDGVWTTRVALGPEIPASDLSAAYGRIVDRIVREPTVTTAVVASAYPTGSLPSALVSPQSTLENAAGAIDADIIRTGTGFFAQLRIPLEGRAFLASDRAGAAPVVIVSRTLANRLWPDRDPIGARLTVGIPDSPFAATVVGVASDISTDPVVRRDRPMVFVPFAQQPTAVAVIGIQTRDLAHLPAIAERAVREVSADAPLFGAEMLEQARRVTLGPQLLAVVLLGAFGISVVVLSTIGVYAVVSHSVDDRRQEMRIRITFGARPSQLVADELLRIGAMIGVSAAAGGACAVAALRLVAATTSVFQETRWLPVSAAMLVVAVVATAATALPAWRATRSALAPLTPR